MIKKSNKTEEVAIRVDGVSKSFKVPHEKHVSIKGAVLNILQKKSYDNFDALKDVSFEVKKGEFFGIIGRNGSGKSTLLKILAGIYVPDSGRAEINGKLSPFLELGVGFNSDLTGRQNLFLGGAILGLTRKEVEKKFEKIVKFAELEQFIDMRLKNYSSGMQVRLAFSLAINAQAEILLMDEVLAVGDNNFQAKCLEEFNRYRDEGKTVVLVTHDIGTITRYCDRAMLLRKGKIVKIGKADEVGNEYTMQNIEDEESRVQEPEEVTKEIESQEHPKKKNKVAEITKVEFLDKNGKSKNVFEDGDDIFVRVYFSLNKEIKNLNFGAALFNQEGSYVFGVNTIFDKVDTSQAIKKGYFQLNYFNIPLLTNSYYFTFALAKDSFLVPIEFMQKSKYFRFISNSKNQGTVELDYKWE